MGDTTHWMLAVATEEGRWKKVGQNDCMGFMNCMRSIGRVNRLVNCGDISVDLITELLFAFLHSTNSSCISCFCESLQLGFSFLEVTWKT